MEKDGLPQEMVTLPVTIVQDLIARTERLERDVAMLWQAIGDTSLSSEGAQPRASGSDTSESLQIYSSLHTMSERPIAEIDIDVLRMAQLRENVTLRVTPLNESVNREMLLRVPEHTSGKSLPPHPDSTSAWYPSEYKKYIAKHGKIYEWQDERHGDVYNFALRYLPGNMPEVAAFDVVTRHRPSAGSRDVSVTNLSFCNGQVMEMSAKTTRVFGGMSRLTGGRAVSDIQIAMLPEMTLSTKDLHSKPLEYTYNMASGLFERDDSSPYLVDASFFLEHVDKVIASVPTS